ncbi:hypothetical protein R1flu_007312 [Riccia fluitans]|uniref:Uncharacterized protein n=1 Tax=Riccia fluitans TaxID=41844 RepID=A0ABD1YYQ4_9MARC
MATCSRKDLKVKVKEVKIPHLTNKNKKKLEAWDLGGLFVADWSQAHEELMKELSGHSEQKVTLPKYEYCGKPEAWTSAVWREVYNLPKASSGGYVMKGKVQFTELQLLKLMEGDKQQVKALGVCNEPTCLGPYLAHMYLHYHELHHEKMKEPKKRKAREQAVSNLETETEEEEKTKGKSPNATWIGEASESKPLDTKMAMNFNEWGVLLHNLGAL